MAEKINVVCPKCNKNMEISIELENTRIECSQCRDTFMAYRAVKCDQCGSFRHPRHECWKCSPENDFAQKYREQKMQEIFQKLPADIQAVLKFESEKNAKMLECLTARIDELESSVAELEEQIEDLKK